MNAHDWPHASDVTIRVTAVQTVVVVQSDRNPQRFSERKMFITYSSFNWIIEFFSAVMTFSPLIFWSSKYQGTPIKGVEYINDYVGEARWFSTYSGDSVHSRIFLAQYILMKPWIFPSLTSWSWAEFHSSSCVRPLSSSWTKTWKLTVRSQIQWVVSSSQIQYTNTVVYREEGTTIFHHHSTGGK